MERRTPSLLSVNVWSTPCFCSLYTPPGIRNRLTRAYISRFQLLAEQLVDDFRVRLPACLLHHLADEEAEQTLLARSVGRDLRLVCAENALDHGLELRRVGDRGVGEVAIRGEAGVTARRDCLDES